MGQRTQIFIRIPAKYYNRNNPNNREEKIIVYHDQWGHGLLLINILENFNEQLNLYTNYYQNHDILKEFPIDYDELVEHIMQHIKYNDIVSVKRLIKLENVYKNFKDINLNDYDNNNGYLFLNIDDYGKLSYSIITGYEETEEPRIVTAGEYLEYFEHFGYKTEIPFFKINLDLTKKEVE